MWFYNKEADAIETLTHLESGVQVIRSGEGDHSELWWRGNVIDRPLEQDEMKLASNDGERNSRRSVPRSWQKAIWPGTRAKRASRIRYLGNENNGR